MLSLDPNVLLALEIFALAVLFAFAIWRLVRHRRVTGQEVADDTVYDMRRDGQRRDSDGTPIMM